MKKPKLRTALATVSLVSTLLTIDSFTKKDIIEPTIIESKPGKLEDSLVVNLDDSYRTFILKTEKEGVKDMRKLVESSELEEAWAFLPEKSMWVEVGYDSKLEIRDGIDFESGVNIDFDYIKKLASENNKIILYHFHPYIFDSLDIIMLYGQNINDEVLINFLRKYEGDFSKYESIILNLSDKGAMLKFFDICYNENSKNKASFKICTKEGVTEYKINKYSLPYELVSWNIDRTHAFFWGEIYTSKENKLLNECKGRKFNQKGIDDLIRRYNSLTDGAIEISFTQYQEEQPLF